MKTLVEIYDNEQIFNILTAYNEKPEEILFLYEDKQESLIHNEMLHKILDTDISYIHYDEKNINEILEKIDKEAAFDIHGGNDFVITAISQHALKNNQALYYPDYFDQEFIIMTNGESIEKEMKVPPLTIKECIGLYGASVRDLPEAVYDEKGRGLVYKLMELKRKNNKRWTSFTKLMSSMNKKHAGNIEWNLEKKSYDQFRGYFEELRDMFVVEDNGKKVKVRFTNKDYMILVTDAGVAFEYDTYYQMVDRGFFDDVDIRVNVDWNGGEFFHEDPNSELDVMATKNGRLISVSCKAGRYDQQAIYEVKTNAVKFGGELAVPVLCTDLSVRHPELVKKAEEIGVLLVEYKDMWDKKVVSRIEDWMKTH